MTEFKVKDLCNAQEMVTLDEEMSVEGGLRRLTAANVLAAPVCDKNGKWVGLIDHLDIVFWALEVSTQPMEMANASETTEADVSAMQERMRKFSLSDMGDGISDKSRLNPYVEIAADAPLEKAIEAFSDGLHRLVVVDEDGKPVHLLTQGRLIQHFAAYPERMGDVGHKNLSEINLLAPVISVNKEEKVLDAFKKLATHRVSGLPVMSEELLWGCLSSTDIKRVQGLRYEALLGTVEEFLSDEDGMGPRCPVSAAPSSTLGSAVALMAANGVHRVFIRTHDGPIAGILTITDVARLVGANPPASNPPVTK